jgi:hypothetical protein
VTTNDADPPAPSGDSQVHAGNAYDDTHSHRGWLLGHFIGPEGSIRHSGDVEVKWGVHAEGEQRSELVDGDERTAVCVLVRGRFCVSFPDREAVVLAREGDYVIWNNVGHTWIAEHDSVTIVIRWPSSAIYS